MDTETKWIIALVTMGVLVAVAFFITSGYHSGCEDCYERTGYFSSVRDKFHIVLDGNDWYISEWYTVGGSMPSDIDKFVNHTVWFRYAAGCGRCMILDMKIIN